MTKALPSRPAAARTADRLGTRVRDHHEDAIESAVLDLADDPSMLGLGVDEPGLEFDTAALFAPCPST